MHLPTGSGTFSSNNYLGIFLPSNFSYGMFDLCWRVRSFIDSFLINPAFQFPLISLSWMPKIKPNFWNGWVSIWQIFCVWLSQIFDLCSPFIWGFYIVPLTLQEITSCPLLKYEAGNDDTVLIIANGSSYFSWVGLLCSANKPKVFSMNRKY